MKIILPILFIITFGCQKTTITLPTNNEIKGVWQEKGYSNKIEIKDSTINQLVGYSLVKGGNISYERNENTLKCKFSSLIINNDSFNLEVLSLTNNYLKVRMERIPLKYEIEFTR